jgi:L-amino acid N-acyltransferase YncA
VASTLEFNQKFDLSKAMIARYPHAVYDGKTLDSYQSCVAGPVCVEREQRGRGIIEGLYRRLFELLPPEYELAVVLVSQDNPRSLNAHSKIGFKPMEQFQFNGRTFDILAIKL